MENNVFGLKRQNNAVQQKINEFAYSIMSYRFQETVNARLEALKESVSKIYYEQLGRKEYQN